MILKELITKVQKLIPKGDFKNIHILFFDFVYVQTETEKPELSDWQKIRDLFLSDKQNQSLALQVLEGQGFDEFKTQLLEIYNGDIFQRILSDIGFIHKMIEHEKDWREKYKTLEIELKNINLKLSQQALDEIERELLEQQRNQLIENIDQQRKGGENAGFFSPRNPITDKLEEVETLLKFFFTKTLK